MNTFCKLSITLLLTFFASHVLAAIELKTVAEIDKTEIDKSGTKIVKRIPAIKVIPGTEVIYTITATNSGDKAAENISVKDPIPKNMIYVEGSAFGSGTSITFSVDGGKTFDKPENLTVKDAKGKPRRAIASDYTHIRWILNFTLKPGDVAPVWFRAKLK